LVDNIPSSGGKFLDFFNLKTVAAIQNSSSFTQYISDELAANLKFILHGAFLQPTKYLLIDEELFLIEKVLDGFDFNEILDRKKDLLERTRVTFRNPEEFIRSHFFLDVLKALQQMYVREYQHQFNKKPNKSLYYFLEDLIAQIVGGRNIASPSNMGEPIIKQSPEYVLTLLDEKNLDSTLTILSIIHGTQDKKLNQVFHEATLEFFEKLGIDYAHLQEAFQKADGLELEIFDSKQKLGKIFKERNSLQRTRLFTSWFIANQQYHAQIRIEDVAKRDYLNLYAIFNPENLYFNEYVDKFLGQIVQESLRDYIYISKLKELFRAHMLSPHSQYDELIVTKLEAILKKGDQAAVSTKRDRRELAGLMMPGYKLVLIMGEYLKNIASPKSGSGLKRLELASP